MKQIIFGKSYGNLGNAPLYIPLGGYQWSQNDVDPTYTNFRGSHPWSVAGTFSHFYVEILAPVENKADLSWDDTTFTLYVNGSATALTVTVPAHVAVAENGFQSASANIVDQVTVSPGDVLSLRRTPPGTLHGNTNAAYANMDWSLTFDSANTGESCYASGARGTKINAASGTYFCAPLNRQLSAWVTSGFADGVDQVASHSIVPLAGSLFRIDMNAADAPGVGNSFTFFCYKNGIKQDGSGGTVDTRITLTGTATLFSATFDLPLVPLDYLSIHIDTSLTTGTFNSYVTVSVGFRATTDGQSALCFNAGSGTPITDGTTDWAGAEGSGWAWTTADSPTPPPSWRPSRWPCTELLISFPGAIDAFTLKGFCVNLSASPGAGKSYAVKTRRAFANAAPKLTMTGASGTASVLNTDPDNGSEDFTAVSDRLNIQSIAAGSPTTTRMGWTWLMVTDTTPVPPVVVRTVVPRRLRRFALPWNGNQWQFLNRFELIMQAGVGLSGTSATQGYDPIVMFRLSRDGGQTWDDELQMGMGKIGEYQRRAFLNRLGRGRNFVVELTCSDPVFVTWLEAIADLDPGTS